MRLFDFPPCTDVSPNPFPACTSLTYRDTAGRVYLGRTMELTADFPYQLLYLPSGREFSSQPLPGAELRYSSRLASLGVAIPGRVPTAQAPLTAADLKVVEGVNEAGLTFSLLAFPEVGEVPVPEENTPVLAATDLGTWTLGQFRTVDEVKAALAGQRVIPEAIALLGGTPAPFHYVLHDRGGKSIVLEFHAGQFHVHDNPVGVLTNGPEFPWHLTNLNNYSFLSNVDRSKATFGSLAVRQPDSGIATAGLPASNTSVGRFVRAVFYREFAEKVSDPDRAVQTLAHIMNNFDRPKGISISPPGETDHLEVRGLSDASGTVPTEYTSWTNLTDLERLRIFLRSYNSLNYTQFDLTKLVGCTVPKIFPLSSLDSAAPDATEHMAAFE
jgi:Penicillin V acylase and related amidases